MGIWPPWLDGRFAPLPLPALLLPALATLVFTGVCFQRAERTSEKAYAWISALLVVSLEAVCALALYRGDAC